MVSHTVIPEFDRMGQEEPEFKTSLGYIARPCFKKTKHGLAEWLKW
jgi:hypothetical protein